MLGPDFIGDMKELKEFCDMLQYIVSDDIKIVPSTEAYNGANNRNQNIVSESDFQMTIDASPARWWRQLACGS